MLPQVQETLAELAAVESMDGSQELFRAHVGALLERLAASHQDWTSHSKELLQFDVVLTHSGAAQTGGLLGTTQEAARPGLVLHSHSRSLSAGGEQLF